MALYTTPDGRVIIGTGVTDGNDYHGYNGKRDIVITPEKSYGGGRVEDTSRGG